MNHENSVLWFNSKDEWIIPVLNKHGAHCSAQQCYKDTDDCKRGEWLVSTPSDSGYLSVSHQEFTDNYLVDQQGMRTLMQKMEKLAIGERLLVEHLDHEPFHGQYNSDILYRAHKAADELMRFIRACHFVSKQKDFSFLNDPQYSGDFNDWIVQDKTNLTDEECAVDKDSKIDMIDSSVQKMQSAFAGDLPVSVWINRSIKLDIPAKTVGSIMNAIAEKGGENGSAISFSSFSKHRDMALDAILRSGSPLTMGVPIEDSLLQKHFIENRIQASSRMVDIAREMLDPLAMEAIKNAHPGEVMPFSSDRPISMRDENFQANKNDNHST